MFSTELELFHKNLRVIHRLATRKQQKHRQKQTLSRRVFLAALNKLIHCRCKN